MLGSLNDEWSLSSLPPSLGADRRRGVRLGGADKQGPRLRASAPVRDVLVSSIFSTSSDARRFSTKIAIFEAKPLDFCTRPILMKNH